MTTTNSQFDRLFKGVPGYKGCFYIQEFMKSLLRDNDFAVINLDYDIPNPPYGIHWVCLLKRKSRYYYFDSLGRSAPARLKLPATTRFYKFALQPSTTSTCGRWVAAWLLWMLSSTRDNAFNEFPDTFSESDVSFVSR
jgi:hypothetical protein